MTFSQILPFRSIMVNGSLRYPRLCAVLLAAACLTDLSAVMPGSKIIGSAAALIGDPGSIFAARSPGVRAAGALTQSKMRRSAQSPNRRASRLPVAARPAKRVQASLGAFAGPSSLSDAPLVPDFAGLASGTGLPPGELFAPVGESAGDGVLPGIGLPGTGGSGGGGGFFDVPPPPIGPGAGGPGGVPEPATWLTLLVGFFAIGHAMRRRTQFRHVALIPHATQV